MRTVSKIAISVPRATLRALDRASKRLRRSRSSVVTLALEEYLREVEPGSADERYVRGYLARPEGPSAASVAAGAVAQWDRWE